MTPAQYPHVKEKIYVGFDYIDLRFGLGVTDIDEE
jgi:hypothetical protein